MRVGVDAHFLFGFASAPADRQRRTAPEREKEVAVTDPAVDVRALAAPLLEEEGLDLVEVEVRGGEGSRLVRVVVDRKGGVPIGAIQEVAGRLSAMLDERDPVEGRYSLEVTSPGVDFPLSGQRDFDRVEGRAVLVHHDTGDGTVAQTRGTVLAAEQDVVVLDVDGSEVRIPYDVMVKASQTLPW
jgi:ribosome maturation factor RimP